MDNITAFLLGALSGVVLCFVLTYTSVQVKKEVNSAVNECESTLPRNQTCKYVITAEVAE